MLPSFQRSLLIAVSASTLLACGEEKAINDTVTEPAAEVIQTVDAPPRITLDTSPINASSPSDAVAQINERDEARRMLAYETGQNIDELLIDVSWPYGQCMDAASLIPPPQDGWRVFAMSAGEWPQREDFARITYSSVDENLAQGTPEYQASKENFSVYVSSATPDVQAMNDLYTNEQLAEMMLMPGPYNYPIRKVPEGFIGRGVLLGDYFVQVDGTGKDLQSYFAQIIRCGIDNGLIAAGVDTSTLRSTP